MKVQKAEADQGAQSAPTLLLNLIPILTFICTTHLLVWLLEG